MLMIRPFEWGDLEETTRLMGDLGYPSSMEQTQRRMERLHADPESWTFVAVADGEVTGMIGIRRTQYYESDDLTAQVMALVTKKARQGSGVGKALIAYAEQWAAANECTSLTLTSGIKPDRLIAHEFYKKRGFDITGYRFVKKLKSSD